ncbi:hypothetical protein [Natrinema sp. CBA1119]|nr:hypothetical protein [Natrinema sp. CBA1119]
MDASALQAGICLTEVDLRLQDEVLQVRIRIEPIGALGDDVGET